MLGEKKVQIQTGAHCTLQLLFKLFGLLVIVHVYNVLYGYMDLNSSDNDVVMAIQKLKGKMSGTESLCKPPSAVTLNAQLLKL